MYKSIKLKNDNDDETDDCNTAESDETIFLQTYAVVLDFYTRDHILTAINLIRLKIRVNNTKGYQKR